MPKTEYSTIQVPRVTKTKIEDFRRRNGYPSNSQAVTALVERGDVSEDVKRVLLETKATLLEETKQAIAKEATSVIVRIAFQFFIDILRESDKPLSQLKLDEVARIIREMEAKEV